jgi:hypothetical protein
MTVGLKARLGGKRIFFFNSCPVKFFVPLFFTVIILFMCESTKYSIFDSILSYFFSCTLREEL